MRALLLAALAIAASSASAWEGESRCPSVPTAEYAYCKDAGAKDVTFFSDGSNFDDTVSILMPRAGVCDVLCILNAQHNLEACSARSTQRVCPPLAGGIA
eukprot:TRINITY_DN50_c0_g2_i1.p3 TRINITY_DN50_c0_g2~~TRINITY_DN50_c0_g2_i1.p3  ORF type:complete len:100 (-),score=3.17 TRINITY_DN50_c0_g2_i1:904-1203(-)